MVKNVPSNTADAGSLVGDLRSHMQQGNCTHTPQLEKPVLCNEEPVCRNEQPEKGKKNKKSSRHKLLPGHTLPSLGPDPSDLKKVAREPVTMCIPNSRVGRRITKDKGSMPAVY